MAKDNIQTTELKFYVARINRINESVEILRTNPWNGLLDSLDSPDADSAFHDNTLAAQFANGLNATYKENGLEDYYCYVLRDSSAQTHISRDIPDVFYRILEEYTATQEEIEEERAAEEKANAEDAAADGVEE
jgi:hypothetical protein